MNAAPFRELDLASENERLRAEVDRLRARNMALDATILELSQPPETRSPGRTGERMRALRFMALCFACLVAACFGGLLLAGAFSPCGIFQPCR